MRRVNKLIISGLTTMGLYFLSASGIYASLENRLGFDAAPKRMRNVTVVEAAAPTTTPAPVPAAAPLAVHIEQEPAAEVTMETASPASEPPQPGTETVLISDNGETVLETTISGGLSIKNETQYWVDAAQIIENGPELTLTEGEPQILVIHTHSSEAYTQAGLDHYEASDTNRTEDTNYNIVRIGDELTDILTGAGLNVIHDRGIYDYPSYTGSYNRSGAAIAQYLESYPSIRIVLDIHRDALGSDGVVYKTMAEEQGVCASQIMLLVGTDESGLEHPDWRQNLALAMYMQNAVTQANPTLMRPVDLVRQRYNQHLSTGSLIIEVGSSGNTLQEALAAIRLFGNAVAPALCELVAAEEPAEEAVE